MCACVRVFSHHSDLAVNNITAVRHDGKDGGRVQQPVNHMYDSIGCHDVGAHQTDALLTQYDPALQDREVEDS